MTDVVERVARAIQAVRGPKETWDRVTEQTRQLWINDARAAIEAMREPTEAMIQAGCDALRTVASADFMAAELSSDRQALAKLKQPIRWRAMINAAITPQTPHPEAPPASSRSGQGP